MWPTRARGGEQPNGPLLEQTTDCYDPRMMAEAIEEDVPAPVITLSLLMRLRSRQEDSFGAKVIAALRNEFGGHAVKGS